MATFYSPWSEHRVHVPCLGGHVKIDSGFIYRSGKVSFILAGILKAGFTDTMGYAFTFHIVTLIGHIPAGAYVHYPTISTDMLARVKSRKKWHTNTDEISSSTILSQAKLL